MLHMANWPCEASIDRLNMMNRRSLHPRWATVAVRSAPVWEGHRQDHSDGAPAFGRGNGHGAGVGIDHGPYDRQPDPRAGRAGAAARRPSLVAPPPRVEHPAKLLCGQAAASTSETG